MILRGRVLYRCSSVFIMTCLMSWMVPERSYSQAGQKKTIHGTVTEKGTGDLLELVHVYISHSTAGTTTDEQGRFEFSTDLTGEHQLVFSFIGYQTKVEDLNLDAPQQHFNYIVEMETSHMELQEIEVVTSNAEWRRNFELFNEQFLGTTEYARKTSIQNPWILDFERNSSRQLVATASEPLQIVNHALGYQLHVDLAEFVWEAEGETGFYTFEIKFEELPSKNPQMSRTRERAYRGSFEHFLTSLYHNNLSRNQFEIVRAGEFNPTTISQLSPWEVRRRQLGRSYIASSLAENLKGYRLQQPVDVLYGRSSRHQDNRIRARLVPLTDERVFFVTDKGRLLNPVSLRLDGYWRGHRVANMLPVEYEME